MPNIRTRQQLIYSLRCTTALMHAGMHLFPLLPGSKVPRDKGFLLHDYRGMDWTDWVKQGGNLGIKAERANLYMDVDPRNGGDLSLDMLSWDLGVDFAIYPKAKTGNGGRHYYMRIPKGKRWRHNLKTYPGIDFQGFGRYVVAPGSIHPDTGRLYTLNMPYSSLRWRSRQLAPQGLMDLLKKPERPPYTGKGGNIDCDQLAELLKLLDAADFGKGGKHHEQWLDIAMACHHGTEGEGFQQWLDWCATDPQYGDEGRVLNMARWESFDSSRTDEIVTYRTLFKAVTDAGHGRAVRNLDAFPVVAARDDFDDEFLQSADAYDNY